MLPFKPLRLELPATLSVDELKASLQQEFGSKYQTKTSKAGFTPKGLLICYSPEKSVWVTVTYLEKSNNLSCIIGPSTIYAIFGIAGILIWNARRKVGINAANQNITSFLKEYIGNASK